MNNNHSANKPPKNDQVLGHELKLYRASKLGGAFTVAVDDYFTLLYGNENYYNIHEYTKESMMERIHNHCCDYVYPDDLPMVKATVQKTLSAGKDYAEWVMRVITGKGNIRFILCSGLFHNDEGATIMDGVVMDITKQKETEEALRLSEEKFRIATQNSDVVFWTYNFARKAIMQTDSSQTVHGYEKVVENVPESLVADGHIREDSAKEFLEMYRKLQSGAKTASGDFWTHNENDNGWWCEHIDYTTVNDAHGKPLYAHAVGRDVTAAKLAEKRYNEEIAYAQATQSEKLLAKVRSNITQNLVESYIAKAHVGISKDGTSYAVAAEQLAATGFTAKQQDHLRSMLSREHILSASAQGETTDSFDYQRKTHDGSVIWVNTTVKTYQNPETKDIMSFMYTYDIDNEKIKEGIIQAVSEIEYDYIAYVDLENNRYKMYFGSVNSGLIPAESSDDYINSVLHTNREIVVPDDVERVIENMMPETIKKNLEFKNVFSFVCGVYHADGSIRQKRMQYAYLDQASQKIVITRSDVTELLNQQKQQQDMLQAALLAAQQASSAKTDFLSRMSHEIRTPMNAIIGMSTIAAQSIGDDRQVADCISKIGISSRFLLSLINDILDMSRIESGKVLLKNDKIPFEEFMGGINSICYSQAGAKGIDYENIVDSNVEDYYIGDAMQSWLHLYRSHNSTVSTSTVNRCLSSWTL